MPVGSNVAPIGTAPVVTAAVSAAGTPSNESPAMVSLITIHRQQHGRHAFAATDEALSDFDLTDF
jgi:hypothetical protein